MAAAPMLSRLLQLVLVGFAVLSAYQIRLFAVKNYGMIIHEFDPWFNFRATQYLADNGAEKVRGASALLRGSRGLNAAPCSPRPRAPPARDRRAARRRGPPVEHRAPLPANRGRPGGAARCGVGSGGAGARSAP